jgi:hypothetical protein
MKRLACSSILSGAVPAATSAMVQTVPPAPVADAGKAKPLYTWAKDAKAGDVTGDGVDQVWQVAVP